LNYTGRWRVIDRDTAADGDEYASRSWRDSHDCPSTFIDRHRTHERGQYNVRVFGQIAIRRVRNIDDVVRLEGYIRGFALADGLVIYNGYLGV
jgi:hypothetical protein